MTAPLIVFFIYSTWLNPISPFYANYDPEFQYLMNSLAVFKGVPYAYVDHPGTPLEIIGTIMYAASYPLLGGNREAFIQYHLQHPGVFLDLVHGFLLMSSMVCVWCFVSTNYTKGDWGKALLASALAVMYFALHPQSFSTLTLWSHNSFNFPFGTLLLLFIFRQLQQVPRAGRIRTPQLLLLGLGAGILSSITIYLAALIPCAITAVIVAYRLRALPWRSTLSAACVIGVSSAAGFLAAVAPVLGRMPTFFKGIGQLLAHEDTQDVIRAGQPILTRLSTSFLEMYRELPALFVTSGVALLLAAVAFVIWRERMHEQPELWALAAGLIVQTILLGAFILDHPKPIYLLSLAASVPVLGMVVLRIFEYHPRLSGWLNWTSSALIIAGVAFSLYSSIQAQNETVFRISEIENQTMQSAREYASESQRLPADLFVLWSYRSYSPCFSLWFGNDSTGRAFRKEIGLLCYRQYEFNVWSQKVISAQGVSTLEESKWDLIIGCEDGFTSPALARQPFTETFPALRLECGGLKIAYHGR